MKCGSPVGPGSGGKRKVCAFERTALFLCLLTMFALLSATVAQAADGSVDLVTAAPSSGVMTVNWTYTADTAGSGIQYFNIYRGSSNTSYVLWSSSWDFLNGAGSYYDYSAIPGSLYFYGVSAVDYLAQESPITWIIAATGLPAAPADQYEPDNSYATASTMPGLTLDSYSGLMRAVKPGHDFNVADDVDWVRFDIAAGDAGPFTVYTSNLGYMNYTYVELYSPADMVNPLKGTADDIDGGPASMFRCDLTAGTYYMKIYAPYSDIAGAGTEYDVAVEKSAALPAPTSVLASNANEGSIDLSWTAPTSNPWAIYVIFRADGSSNPADAVEWGCAWETDWRDFNIEPGKTYTYWVAANDDYGFLGPKVVAEPALIAPKSYTSHIAGKVVDMNGAPLVGVDVNAENTEDYISYDAVTGSDGRYSISLPAGNYSVTAYDIGIGSSGSRMIAASADDVDFSVEVPPYVISGYIKNYNDQGQLVTITSKEAPGGIYAWVSIDDNWWYCANAVPNEFGYFELRVPTGTYELGSNTVFG